LTPASASSAWRTRCSRSATAPGGDLADAGGHGSGRYLARHGGDGGDGGYMVIFDLEISRERARARWRWACGWSGRSTCRIISGTHLHPADMRGAIVSLDCSRPYGSWRWGGPQWTGRTGVGAPGRLAGITVAVADPVAAASRWGDVLGVAVSGAPQPPGAQLGRRRGALRAGGERARVRARGDRAGAGARAAGRRADARAGRRAAATGVDQRMAADSQIVTGV